MNYAKVHTAQVDGLAGRIVDVEIDIARGLYSFSIVGLPDKAVEEARDRVAAAIKNTGLESPKQRNQKVVVSLAPADIPKTGARFDLAIAVGYLLAVKDLEFDPQDKLFIGELSLDGSLRGIKGVLRLVQEAKENGFKDIFVPQESAVEAALISGIDIYPAANLNEVVQHLKGEATLKKQAQAKEIAKKIAPHLTFDIADVRGQQSTKRALEIAAAGGHNLAMYGPPGTGKTMLAKAFTGILPDLTEKEMLETTAIHSVAGQTNTPIYNPPYRQPHHSASHVAITGGGTNPKPGEMTLAHNGVLFLDEFPEFERRVLEALRQPLESGEVVVSRAGGTYSFPAKFILLVALNPCPCGFFGTHRECVCSPIQLERYRRKLSGPIVDRIDLWTEVSHVEIDKLGQVDEKAEKSEVIKNRVKKARDIQAKRYAKKSIDYNRDLPSHVIERVISITDKAKTLVQESAKQLELSPRAYFRVLKVSRTIADLEVSENVEEKHVLEALQYRPKVYK